MMNFEVVHFAPHPWSELQKNGFRKTAGAMLKVLWERPDIKQLFFIQNEHRWGFKVGIERVDEKLTVVGLPIGFPFERFYFIRKFNKLIQSLLLKMVFRKKSLIELIRIYWFYDWIPIELISLLPKAYTIMEITDTAEHFYEDSAYMLQTLGSCKELALRTVDLFIPLSESLEKEVIFRLGDKVVLSNGISRDFIEKSAQVLEEPKEYKNISEKRICVVGTGWSLNYRLDHKFLIDLMTQISEWQLILIGCEYVESQGLAELVKLQNVHFVGLVPINNLPAYIQHCTVCAVPYKKEAGKSGGAIKIYEYLACNKKVIVTVDEIRGQLKEYISYAPDCTTFIENLNENELVFPKGFLEDYSWEKRLDKVIRRVKGNINDSPLRG